MSGNLLEISDLHARIATPQGDGREILKGVDLVIAPGEVHAIMGPNGAGKSTLSSVLTGKSQYEVTSGSILFKGQDVLQMPPEQRAWMGIFMSFQYPVEIPGISITRFMKEAINSKRKANGLPEMGAAEYLKYLREKMAMLHIDPSFAKRDVNVGFSGGEKKKCEIFQMAALEPVLSILDETDSGLDVDALKIVSDGVNALRSKENSTIVITHYRRLLEYIVPDVVHVLKDGKIIKTGDKSLVDFIENNGYDAIK